MKKLHYPVFTYTVYLTDGEKYSRKYMCRMKYSDADDREMNNKVYTIDELDRLIEENVVWCEKSLFKKNTYIRLHVPYEESHMDKWIQKQIEEIGGIDPTYKVDTCTHCKYRTYGGMATIFV